MYELYVVIQNWLLALYEHFMHVCCLEQCILHTCTAIQTNVKGGREGRREGRRKRQHNYTGITFHSVNKVF